MAHPQHNFTSNFNGSDGHNAELTLNINGVEKKYTPAGNDQTYNVPGVARIDINLDGADLVQAIQTALDGAAQPVLVEMSVYDEEVAYQYIGDMDDNWYFGTCTTNKIVTVTVAKEDGALNTEQIPVANGVVIVPSDGLNVYSQLRTAIALGQLPVLSYVGANPVYAQYEKTADNGDLIFVGAFATKSTSNRIQCIIYKVASDNTITTETYASFSGAYNDLTGKPDIKKNKMHRYSFGDATVDGETPVYGYWLIDLDKPDPNGPEGYARVTPAEFWKSTAVNGEVPVYLQDKNANNSLTYAYLSRTDVTKSGDTVTNVFAYFVRSGYDNVLACSVGFRFTKLPGSDYLQRATSTDDSFDAHSVAMSRQSIQSVEHTVKSNEFTLGNIRIPLSHYDRGEYLLNIQLYAGGSSHFGSKRVPLRVSFRYKFDGSEAWSQEYTGALEQIDQSGPWYYGSTIQLYADMPGLTGIDVEFYFGPNKLPANDTIDVKISYLLLSKPS